MSAHAAAIDAATDLPVSADLENGYGAEPEHAARAVTAVAGAGAVLGSLPWLVQSVLHAVNRPESARGHGWIVIVSGFFEPLFYLLSIGFGLGALVGSVPGPGGAEIP